jgi:hypothetical protein
MKIVNYLVPKHQQNVIIFVTANVSLLILLPVYES